MNILVAITNHGTKNEPYLRKIIDEYRSMSFDIDIVVISNIPKEPGDDIEVVINIPAKNPWALPYSHKKLFADRIDKYDLFIYSEDDTLIEERNIHAFLNAAKLLPSNEIAGFFRYEIDKNGKFFYSTVHTVFHWDPASVKSYKGNMFAYFTNEHSASYILTRDQLKKAIDSGWYLNEPYEGRYDMLCSAATDPYTRCGFRKMICFSNLEDFSLHHLPNTYIGKIGLGISEIEQQVNALKEVEKGLKSAAQLFDPKTHLTHSLWDKNYYEPCDQDILEIIPKDVKSVLSVGCGWGDTEAQLVKKGVSVVGIPLDSVIGSCAEAKGVETVSPDFDMAIQELSKKRFDCLLISKVLQHLEYPFQILTQLVKLLDEDAFVVVSVPNFHHISIYGKRLTGKSVFKDFKYIGNYKKSGLHSITSGKIEKWYRQIGLKPDYVKKYNFYLTTSGKVEKWFWQNGLAPGAIFRKMVEKCPRLANIISSFLGEIFAARIIAVGRKVSIKKNMISVVVATFNRVSLLTQLLEILLHQSIDSSNYEIIVVDDGSVDNTTEVMAEYTKKYNNIEYLRQENQGPAKARNRGIEKAMGNIIAFTDDDCIPDASWLEVVKKKFAEDSSIAGLEGMTYTMNDQITPLTHTIVNSHGGAYPTCNIAYRAECVKQEGGFDERFPFAHNEDVDLAWRMLNYGKIVFSTDMLVCHPPRPESLSKKVKWVRFLGSDFFLFYKHPEKYRKTRATNPWNNLYIRFLLFMRLRSVLRWIRYWRKPWFFFQSLALVTCQIGYLLYLIPCFRRVELEVRRELKFNNL